MSQKKQDIIKTAFRLFSENGFYATGIDQIIAESSVSKKTLYTHFSSKIDLILAVLQYYEQSFISELQSKVLNAHADPHNKLIRIFEIAQSWYSTKKFNGCLAISAMGEFGNKNEDIVKACVSFKQAERNILLSLVNEMELLDADQVADHLLIVLEGIGVTAHIGSITPSQDSIRRLVGNVLLGKSTYP